MGKGTRKGNLSAREKWVKAKVPKKRGGQNTGLFIASFLAANRTSLEGEG